ncbi:MAG: hypothetical protein ACYS4W_02425 [Planctomycetota bacterium]|jgi:hypothetical protein
MGRMPITTAVFAVALVLIMAVYVSRGNRRNDTSELSPEDSSVSDQADGGDE